MPIVSVRIPQLGEGLQEALLVEFLKQPGDSIKRDEPIYVMETDKATSEVESPYSGQLVEWVVQEGQVLEIGTKIATMEVAEDVKEMPAGHEPAKASAAATVGSESGRDASAATSVSLAESSVAGGETSSVAARSVQIPPRTRKYLKEKGLLDRANTIPVAGTKMMPEDVDRFLASSASAGQSSGTVAESTDEYDEVELQKNQITLNYRLTRGAQVCVPVTVMTEVDWTAIATAREIAKASDGPTGFTMMLWCVTRALARHAKFRSSLSTDGRIQRTYHAVNLGIAVARPGDELVTAVVREADRMPPSEFFAAVNDQIAKARDGDDQVDASTTISITNIGGAGMRIGMPAIVAPAMATLALGETFDLPVPTADGFAFRKTATLTLSFDHRVVNGVGGADFLRDVKQEIESYQFDG